MAATPASLVDSTYQDGDLKEDSTLVSYDGDDVQMRDEGDQSEDFSPPLPMETEDNASPLSANRAPTPQVPSDTALYSARAVLQLQGLFPDPPTQKCNPKLQQKVNGFLERIKRGEVPTPVRHIRSTKNFNNPEILSEIVSQFEIVEHGTHLQPDVWDPYHFPKEDYIDALQLSGAPKPPAPAPIVVKSTPPKESAPPTPTTPAASVAVKSSSTIITRKSGATTAVPLPGIPGMVNPRQSLVEIARQLTQQGFAAPAMIPR